MTGRKLFGIALAVATVVGLASTVLLKVAIALVGGSVSWAQAATGWIDWYLWAALTPLVVWLARALPISGRNWARPVAAHVLIGAAISAAELALFALVMTGYNAVFMQFELPRRWNRSPRTSSSSMCVCRARDGGATWRETARLVYAASAG